MTQMLAPTLFYFLSLPPELNQNVHLRQTKLAFQVGHHRRSFKKAKPGIFGSSQRSYT